MHHFLDKTQVSTDVLQKIFAACDQHYWGMRPTGNDDAKATTRAVLDSESTCHIVVCMEDETPVGFASYAVLVPGVEGKPTLFMKDMFVIEEARGREVGKVIFSHVRKLAKELGCARFDWTSEVSNTRATKFYNSVDAEIVSEKIYWRIKI